ncbi:MAG: hypothetical protein KDD63_08830 [Bacteroidetes bacterium]|nr:hypothetical protein [Bacteroidota bacterium]
MRTRLKKFTQFADGLLPHETRYLLSVQQMVDPVKLEILRQIDENCQSSTPTIAYDESIDKRKYSHLKNWINRQLKAIDVDEEYAWMCDLEQKIHWDNINPKEEKDLLKFIRNYSHPIFNFIKFYEVVRQYRQFLLVRLRYTDHQFVDHFLREYQAAYERSQLVNQQLHQATRDIIDHYSENSSESIQWEKWLSDVFYDDYLDGFNRYTALIRLVFIAFNYNKYTRVKEMFDYLDQAFAEGKYYSRRILLNYYNNRLLLHTRLKELDLADYYGKLSIRGKNYDFIFYVNNLCSLLLQSGKVDESWNILRDALPSLKTTHNYHSRIGFVALYIKTLIMKEEYEKAYSYGEINLKAYEKEILRYRWHRFFVSYLECLLFLGKYSELVMVVNRYGLLDKEKNYKTRPHYLPTISWYFFLAQYQLGDLSFSRLIEQFQECLPAQEEMNQSMFMTLMERLKKRFPQLDKRLMEMF